MNPIQPDKGKIEIMKAVNASKKELNAQIDQTITSQHERTVVNGTAGTFNTPTPSLPKESLNKMPELKVKDVEKSPMIEKIQMDKKAFDDKQADLNQKASAKLKDFYNEY